MLLLGLLLPTIYVAGLTGASIPTQWALLSLFLPALVLRGEIKLSVLHLLGALFFGYALLGLLWAPHWKDGVYGIWLVTLWALSFQLGLCTDSPRSLYRGLAIGLFVSIPFAIAQWYGYHPVPTFLGSIAGLLFNSTLLGAASALVILALIEEDLWLYTPALFLALLLSGSRGGLLVLVVGLASRIHWAFSLIFIILGAYVHGGLPSDVQRLKIWGIALHGLTWLGWSANSFIGVYYVDPVGAIHPEFVHNDYLQLIFEFGIFAAIPFSILALALAWRPSPLLWGIAVLGTFYFPLYAPLTAFLACFAVGHALRGFSLDGFIIGYCRPDLLSWPSNQKPIANSLRREAIPIQPRTSTSQIGER